MEALANFVIATVDLVEAEGRALQSRLVRLGTAAALAFVGLLVAIAGLAFLLIGLYWVLAQQMSHQAAALVFGVVALGLAGGMLWIARLLIR